MAFAEDQDVIQTVAPEHTEQALSMGVLPGRPRRDRTIANPHGADSTCEGVPVGAVIVAHQIGRGGISRECLHDLLRQPLRRRIPGYRKPQQLSPSVANHKKSKQALERRGLGPHRDQSLRWLPRDCAGMSAKSATAALAAGSYIWKL